MPFLYIGILLIGADMLEGLNVIYLIGAFTVGFLVSGALHLLERYL